jgi:excisionase family DNA binding protein
MPNDAPLLSTRDVAQLLAQSEDTVRRKAKRGELPSVKIGLSPRAPFRFDRSELEAWLYGRSQPVAMAAAVGAGGLPFAGPPNPGARDSGTAPRRETPQSSPSRCAGRGERR